jgi:hypothetical protein
MPVAVVVGGFQDKSKAARGVLDTANAALLLQAFEPPDTWWQQCQLCGVQTQVAEQVRVLQLRLQGSALDNEVRHPVFHNMTLCGLPRRRMPCRLMVC